MKTAASTTERHDRGSYYTPPELVARVAPLALQTLVDKIPVAATWRSLRRALSVKIIDPACGDGNFLLGAAEFLAHGLSERFGLSTDRLRGAIMRRCLFGIDIDPSAIASARTRLSQLANGRTTRAPSLARHLVGADSLLVDWPKLWPPNSAANGFDAVIGNPPFVDAETMSRTSPTLRRAYRDRWSTARGNWDLCVPFVELSLNLLRPGASLALVLPNKLLHAKYAERLRELLDSHHLREVVDLSTESTHWNAGVYPIVLHVERSSNPEAFPAASTTIAFASVDDRFAPLCSVATIHGAATVAEAYEMVAAIEDLPADSVRPADSIRVVNTGTIRRYRHAWGEKPLRYLGQRYLRPVMLRAKLRSRWPRRADQAAMPKLIVAGLAKELRACFDPHGELLAAKSTVVISSEQVDLRLLAALLNSRRMSDLYRTRFGGLALQGGYLQFTTAHLKALPIPWPERLLERSDLVAEITSLVECIHRTCDPAEFLRLDEAIETRIVELLGEVS
jgi:SAM-dependent methyltransferase